MKSLKRFIRERTETPPLLYSAPHTLGMPLRDFIDALQLLDAQKSEEEHTVEIGLSCPEPHSISVTFFPQHDETDSA